MLQYQKDNKMNQGNFNQNAKDSQNIQPQNREGAPAYYSNPQASKIQNGRQYPIQYGQQYPIQYGQQYQLQYGQQYQLQPIQRQYPSPPIAPYPQQPFYNYNDNYTIHWGKVFGFLVLFGLNMYVYIAARVGCPQTLYNICQVQTALIVIYAVFGLVYLLINAIICQIKIQNLSPLCLFLVSNQYANGCQCWLGVLAGLFIVIYFPITFICFIYFMIKHFCKENTGQKHQQNQVPGSSAHEIVANNNF